MCHGSLQDHRERTVDKVAVKTATLSTVTYGGKRPMRSKELPYLTEDGVKQCITMREAVVLSRRDIQTDAAGQVA
jgi:hypothetical protein